MQTKWNLREALKIIREEISKDPDFTRECVEQALLTTAEYYVRYGLQINPRHAWRWGKLKDSADSAQYMDSLFEEYELPTELLMLFELLAFAADLGRVVIVGGEERGGKKKSQATHGKESANILAPHALTKTMRAALLAIEHHSDIENPDIETMKYDDLAHILCLLLRDIDMASAFLGKGTTYLTPSEMARQKIANGLSDSSTICDYCVSQFVNGEPIDRIRCTTYPEFMLQFLAWGYNFTFDETWRHVVASCAPNAVLAYIRDSLLHENAVNTWYRIYHAAQTNLGIMKPAE